MLSYLLKRLWHGVFVALIVMVTMFLVTRLLVDPVKFMVPVQATNEDRQVLSRALGLDQPISTQFLHFVRDLLQFDFGISYWQGLPAMDLIAERLPATLQLVGVSLVLVVLIFIPLGVVASLKPGSWVDQTVVTTSLFGLSMPQFWLGAMLILVFSVELGLLPTSGSGTWQHVVLPSLTLALTSGGRVAQVARSTMIDRMNEPFVMALKARGLNRREIVGRHVLRTALVPIVTLTAWEAAYALAGYSVVVETVFGWPGIGRLAIQAATQRDIVLLQAIVFVVAVLVVLANLLADLSYQLIDPRLSR